LERNVCAVNQVGSRVALVRFPEKSGFLSLQSTASPRAKWPKQHFIFKAAGRTHVVHKPDGSGSPEA